MQVTATLQLFLMALILSVSSFLPWRRRGTKVALLLIAIVLLSLSSVTNRDSKSSTSPIPSPEEIENTGSAIAPPISSSVTKSPSDFGASTRP